MADKTGPVTIAELIELWTSSTDPGFNEPIIAAGEGKGFEVYTQVMAQLARVSEAVDVSTQAMFVLPWSGQSNLPAAGAAFATVTLKFTRSLLIEQPLILKAGSFVEEDQNDWSETGSTSVLTGRRYALTEDLVFMPGETGPFEVLAVAERPGYGYNNPRINTLTHVTQVGADFTNNLASMSVPLPFGSAASAVPPVYSTELLTENQPDTAIPEHVGQYVRFLLGSNLGLVLRAIGYSPPNLSLSPPSGGGLVLEPLLVVRATAFGGTFAVGEQVRFHNGGPNLGYGVVKAEKTISGSKFLAVVLQSGVSAPNVVGMSSAATFTVAQTIINPSPVAEVTGATWRVLDWIRDWGLTVTNEAQPTGGVSPMLDELGAERGIDRAPSELDITYRPRVAEISEVVSPNALTRAANRVLAPNGLSACIREVGLDGSGRAIPHNLTGFFYDAVDETGITPDALRAQAWDFDEVVFTGGADSVPFLSGERVTQAATGAIGTALLRRTGALGPIGTPVLDGVRPLFGTFVAGSPVVGERTGATRTPTAVSAGLQHRDAYKVWLDAYEFRGFFLVQVPRLGTDEFGMAYDAGAFGGYDLSSPFMDFYDGYPWTASALYRAIYDAVASVKAGGVGFDLVQDTDCT